MACLIRALTPAVESVRHEEGDLVNNAAKANARMIAEKLSVTGPILSERVNAGTLKVVPAYYNIVSGAVEFPDTE